MNKKLTRILAVFLVIIMLPITTYAMNFKDIKSNHWAKDYIDKCSNLGFINGFPDGTFKPNNPIRFLELTKMLSYLFNVPENEMQAAESLYGSQLDSLNPAPWARQYLLKLLAKGVVNMKVLESAKETGKPNMLKDNAQFASSRTDTSVLFVKAMGLTPTATSLTYIDKDEIKASAVPSIGALQKAGVLNPQGDESGKFRPEDPLSRAEVAKMLYVAYEYVEKNGGLTSGTTNPQPTPSNPTNPVGSYDTVIGTFNNIFDMGNGMNYISINDRNNKLRVYNIPSKVSVKLNGSTASIANIEEGMDVTLVVQGETVISAEFKRSKETIEGIINNVSSHSYDVKIDYKENNRKKEITLDFKDAKIRLDGKTANIDDLKNGYEVKILYSGDKALEVEAKKNNVVDGFFVRFEYNYRDREYRVYYRKDLNSGYEEHHVLSDYVYINKNKEVGSRELINQNSENYFVKDQPISFEFDRDGKTVNGIYYDFYDNRKDGIVFGYIYEDIKSPYREIKLSSNPYSNSNIFYVNLDNYVDIYNNNNSKKYFPQDLKRGMTVNIKMKNGYAEKIEILNNINYDINKKYTFIGELRYLDSQRLDLDISNALKINNDNNSLKDYYNMILIDEYGNDKTIFMYRGIKTTVDNLLKTLDIQNSKYNVKIIAEYTSSGFVAREVIVTESLYWN